jgi:DNA-binding transcriptional LysR family regulator
VSADVAGVMFTVDPVHGRKDRIMVEAVLGLGEAVVSGEVTPDHYLLKRDGRIAPLLGVWPGLAERPDVRYVLCDWLAKLQIVAAGLAITTLAPVLLDVLPDGVKIVAVRGEPQETRRLVLASRPGALDGAASRVADALIAAARA